MDNGWIGVDFDGTLATYNSWNNETLGQPVPKMVERIQHYLTLGVKFKILTARAECHEMAHDIQEWLVEQGLPRLEVTNKKDNLMLELWDTHAHRVILNTGEFERETFIVRIYELESQLSSLNK